MKNILKFLKKLTKKQKIILLIILILVVVAGLIVIYSSSSAKDLSVNYVVVEPNAPLAQNLKINNPLSNNQTNLGTISSLETSPDKTGYLALNSQNDNKLNALTLTDTQGKIVNKIQNSNVINAQFQDNNIIIYQTINNSSAGVYTYNIKENKNNLVINSTDPQTFNDLVMIDNINYFFIQPKTGTIGFGKVGSNDKVIIDQKALRTESPYVQASAYKFPVLSPDKRYIAFFAQDQESKSFIDILPINAKSIKDLYYQVEIPAMIANILPGQKIVIWSNDSKYLNISNYATIIDIINKKILFNLPGKIATVNLSPDSTRFIVNNESDNQTYVKNIKSDEQINIAKDISVAEWLDNNSIILIIGQRLYTFDLTNKKLEAVNNDRATFRFLDIDTTKGIALVKENDQVIQVIKSN